MIWVLLTAVSRIEQIQDVLHEFRFSSPDIQPHEVTSAEACFYLLKDLHNSTQGGELRVVLDVEPDKAKSVVDQVVSMFVHASSLDLSTSTLCSCHFKNIACVIRLIQETKCFPI